MPAVASRAEVAVLTATAPDDNNSLEEPLKVAPDAGVLEVGGPEPTVEFKPYSFTVVHFRTRN
jgi:alpha-L-arabinofuranosidase